MTGDEEADLALLRLANERGKFAIPLGQYPEGQEPLQRAFERGIDQNWFTLVDVSLASACEPMIYRIFRLTLAGYARREGGGRG